MRADGYGGIPISYPDEVTDAEPPEPYRGFAVAVQAVVLRLRRLGERRLAIEAIPLSEVDVLTNVMDHPGRSVTDVAHALSLQSSNVSTTVRQLVARGLLVREADPLDGRRSRLFATEQAVADRNSIDEAWTKVIGEFLDGLDPTERANALAATDALRLLAALDLAAERAVADPGDGTSPR